MKQLSLEVVAKLRFCRFSRSFGLGFATTSLIFLASAASLSAELQYGNPAEECPSRFRLYTMFDYLYWQASEDGLEYAMKETSQSPFGIQGSVHSIDFPFDNGFRIGGGLVLPRYDWQVEVDWTRFYNYLRETAEQTVLGNPSLIGLWMSPVGHGTIGWEDASFSWELKFDTLDLDLLRIGFVNANFSLAPRIGLKRAWINQHFHVRYETGYDPTSGLLSAAFYDVRFSNDFRSIGPRFGIDTQLKMGWGFGIAANAAAALLYGPMHAHRIDVSSQFGGLDLAENVNRFKPMAQGEIALDWTKCFDNSMRLQIYLGYEAQIWWGQNQLRGQISSALPSSNLKANGALTLNGLDLHARFDF